MSLKSIGKSAIVYGLGNLLQRASSAILIPIYTRFLSVQDFGLLDTSLVSVRFLQLILSLGMPQSIIRFYSEKDQTGTLNGMIGSAFMSVFLAALAGFAGLLGYFAWTHSQWRPETIALVLLVYANSALLCAISNMLMIYRARNQAMRFSTVSIALSSLNCLFTVVWFVALPHRIHGALAAQIAAGAVILAYTGRQLFSRAQLSFSLGQMRELTAFGFPTIFNTVAWYIIVSSDRYVLLYFKGLEEVGIYSLGNKVTFLLLIFVGMPFQMAYSPYVFSNLKKKTLKEDMACMLTLLLLVVVSGCYLIAIFKDALVSVLSTDAYAEASLVILWLLPAAAMKTVYQWLMVSFYVRKKTYLIMPIIVGLSLLNIALNFLLIPRFGWTGAAFATNAAVGLSVAVFLFIGQRIFPIPFETRRLAVVFAAAGAMTAMYIMTINLTPWLHIAANTLFLGMIPFMFYGLDFYTEKELGFMEQVYRRRIRPVIDRLGGGTVR